MKVICPKCQFENLADSARVVCARCATIIEVRLDQTSGLDANGKRQTARLPFGASPNSGQNSNSQPININSQQLNQTRDAYATRIGDDFDDVLDIPRPVQSNSQTGYDSPIFDDVFTTPDYDYTAAYDYSTAEKKAPSQIDNYQVNMARQRETQDYVSAAEPEFMGWPMLPENSVEEDDTAIEPRSRRGGLIFRIVACVLVFGGLISLAYYFLGDLLKNREKEPAVASTAQPNQPQNEAPLKSDTAVPPLEKRTTAPGVTDGKQVPVPIGPNGRDVEKQQPKPTPPNVPNKGNFTIQVASFSEQAQANERVASLKASGIEARVVRADIPGIGVRHRVHIGAFGSRNEASGFGVQLKLRGLVDDFIVTTK